ncbi:MAG: D-alanyl-D-alanine carboxypeptidase/D-alanyl-D-alanine-endopeptidase [Acidobacteriota bacterium]|nr:D-alanyl-D-alanine carboxypeptidase/D-alanyl-D-alanine-endopeptidase [Acidobacteriota bacterium]
MDYVRLVLLILTTTALTSSAEAQLHPDSGQSDGARRGYVAVRMTGDGTYDVIDAVNAEGLFVPASVLKLVTVSAALDYLGPDYQWRTIVLAEGRLEAGVLDGDLVIQPDADPTWEEEVSSRGGFESVETLASQIRDAGLKRVRGDLVVDKSRFPGRSHPLDRSYADLPYRHGTPPAGLAVNQATIQVRVGPGSSVGAPALVSAPEGVDILNHTMTVGTERHGKGSLDFIPVWGTEMLLLRGEYPISEGPFVVAVSDPRPELRVGRYLRAALEELGVAIEGSVRFGVPSGNSSGRSEVVAELRSGPLRTILRKILASSQNWYADMLVLTLSKAVAGTGRFDDGVAVVSNFLSGLSDRNVGPLPRPWLRDGSGLSPANLVTPISIVGVLGHALTQDWAEILLGALPGPGEGTLAGWSSVPQIAAKTGTLRHTVGLAGFLDAGPEGPVVFCYFVNHLPGRPRVAREQIASALARWQALEGSR